LDRPAIDESLDGELAGWSIAASAVRRFHPMGNARAELLAPAANRLVADRHAAPEQPLFNVAPVIRIFITGTA
jgi:hypothetical protein